MRLKAIINPVSGQNKARHITAEIIERLKKKHAVKDNDIYYTSFENKQVEISFFENCDVIVVAGGDGTLHYAVNTIKRLGVDKPVAYLPTGTINDFGSCLNLPREPDKFCEMLERTKTKKIDLGLVGDEYFHYVVAGGAINSVSYTTNQHLKNAIGEAAYYLSAISRFSRMLKGTHIKIDSDELQNEQEALLYLVTNSSIVGGFKGIVPDAKMDDGQLHVLVIKKSPLLNTLQLFIDIKNGTHIRRPDVLYFKTKSLSITQFDTNATQIGIDGEMRNVSSRKIEIVPQALTMIVPAV